MRYIPTFPAVAVASLMVTLPAAPASATSIVFPTGAETQVQAMTNIDATTVSTPSTESISLQTGTATSASVSGTTGSAHASADLTTGQLKVDATSTAGFTSTASGWEFLTFSGSGTIDFSFSIDGTLSNSIPSGMVYVEPGVRIYDVTEWTSYFGTISGLQMTAVNGSGSPFPYIVGSAYGIEAVRGASSGGCNIYGISPSDCTVDSSGTPVPVNLALSGSATVMADRLYLVELQLSTATYNQQLSIVPQIGDFSHTATFDFTNLNGLTFESSSGQFLAAANDVPVPEPATVTLVGLGMAMAAMRRRRGRSMR